MSRRRQFLPTAVAELEQRVLLSPATAHGLTVGAVGDSYTDEYRFYPPDRSQARNWVEIVAHTRGINFGPFRVAGRGEPRDQGFAFNWARSDSTSSDLVANQLPGLAAQVARGQVRYARVFTGGNDFLDFLRSAAGSGNIQGPAVLGQLAQVEARAAANFTRTVQTLLAANPRVRLVVATLPDVALMPLVQAAVGFDPAARGLVAATSREIALYNTLIRRVADSNPRIALADLAGAAQRLTSAPSGGSVSFGGTTIDLKTAGDNYHDLFLADGIHLGTVGQGVIADTFLAAIDAKFRAGIPLLSPRRIVHFASHVRPSTP